MTKELKTAIDVLRALFEVHDLGDFIYTIREVEGLGWDGKNVRTWSHAVTRAKELIARESTECI